MATHDTTRTTRRAAIAALAGAAPLVGIMAAGISEAAEAADRSEWNAAMRAFEAAEAEYDAFDRRTAPIFKRCHEEWEAVPHVEITIEGEDRTLSTANPIDMACARGFRRVRQYGEDFRPTAEAYTALLAADERRREQQKAIRERHGIAALQKEDDRLCTAACRAENALLHTPAPDGEALLWKLERLLRPDGDGSISAWDYEAMVAPVMADARRLLSRGRA